MIECDKDKTVYHLPSNTSLPLPLPAKFALPHLENAEKQMQSRNQRIDAYLRNTVSETGCGRRRGGEGSCGMPLNYRFTWLLLSLLHLKQEPQWQRQLQFNLKTDCPTEVAPFSVEKIPDPFNFLRNSHIKRLKIAPKAGSRPALGILYRTAGVMLKLSGKRRNIRNHSTKNAG